MEQTFRLLFCESSKSECKLLDIRAAASQRLLADFETSALGFARNLNCKVKRWNDELKRHERYAPKVGERTVSWLGRVRMFIALLAFGATWTLELRLPAGLW